MERVAQEGWAGSRHLLINSSKARHPIGGSATRGSSGSIDGGRTKTMRLSGIWRAMLTIVPVSISLLLVSLSAANAVSRLMTQALVGFMLAPRAPMEAKAAEPKAVDPPASAKTNSTAALHVHAEAFEQGLAGSVRREAFKRRGPKDFAFAFGQPECPWAAFHRHFFNGMQIPPWLPPAKRGRWHYGAGGAAAGFLPSV